MGNNKISFYLVIRMPTFLGEACEVKGEQPKIGDSIHLSTRLVDKDLKSLDGSQYKGKKLVINCFPSIDTPVCAASVKKFNEKAAESKILLFYVSQLIYLSHT